MMARSSSRRGFTILELLVSLAIYAIILVVLVELATQTEKLWKRGVDQNDYRLRARAVLSYMGQEMSVAAVPITSTSTNLQFVINPESASGYANADSVFWQAPIATDTSAGDLAEVGYFVQWNSGIANLCRFFVNPSNTENYLIYSSPENWLTSSLLQTVAPATAASNYQGLFLQNVIGLWVTAYPIQTNDEAPEAFSGTTYDSRNPPSTGHPLPGSVDISLAFVDASTAQRIKATGAATTIAGLYGSANAQAFVASLPAWLQSGTTAASLRISMKNYK